MKSKQLSDRSTGREQWEAARRSACEAAAEAWSSIGDLYERGSKIRNKSDGPQTEADLLADLTAALDGIGARAVA